MGLWIVEVASRLAWMSASRWLSFVGAMTATALTVACLWRLVGRVARRGAPMMPKLWLFSLFAVFSPVIAYGQSYTVMPSPIMQFLSEAGAPYAAGKLYTYAAGTTTPLDSYSDSIGTANANPVILDAAGRATVYLSANTYKFVLTTSADVTVWTRDNVNATHAGLTGLTNTADLTFQVDTDNNGSNSFIFQDGAAVTRATLSETGDLQIDDDLTIGDATAADHDLVFDGNAFDFYMCLDDSVDELVLGVGSVCGTTRAIRIHDTQDVTFLGAILAFSATQTDLTFTGTSNTNINTAGGVVFRLDTDTSGIDSFYVTDTGSTTVLQLTETGLLNVRDSANANITIGLNLNQAANDDGILAVKSSDVGHAMTGSQEADTFGSFIKSEDTSGGLEITGWKDGDGVAGSALVLTGNLGEAADTTHTAAGVGVVEVVASVTDGATGIADSAANSNLFVVKIGSGATKFIVDREGDTFQDGTAGTAYSAYDDAMLALAYEYAINPAENVREAWAAYSNYNRQYLVDAGIFAPDDAQGNPGFVNMSALLRLTAGGLWKEAIKQKALDQRLTGVEGDQWDRDQRIVALEADNAELAARVAAIDTVEAENQRLAARLAALESTLGGHQLAAR